MSTDKDKSCQGTSRQRLVDSAMGQDSSDSRTKIMEEMIAAKSKAQLARCEDLMARLRTIELAQVQDHVEKQLKHMDQVIDSKLGVRGTSEGDTPFSIDKSLFQTDYDNSLIDCIEQEMQEDVNAHHPLRAEGAMDRARYLFHKNERKSVKAVSHVLSEIIGNTLPDYNETESESEDENREDQVLYKTVEKEKVRQYRPVDTTPVAKWAKYRSHAISSWSWLNQTISQTEFRLKKQEALYNQLRRAKPMFKHESPACVTIQRKDTEEGPASSQPSDKPVYQSRRQSGDEDAEKRTEERTGQNDDNRAKGPSSSKNLYEGVHSSSLNLLADVSELSESLKRENIEQVMNTIQHNRSADQTSQGIQLLSISPKDNEVDATQVASRCRPLMPYKPRKIYKMHGIGHFMNEILDIVQPGECPCDPGEGCIYCLGNKYKCMPEGRYLTFQEEMEAFDPSFHKSLSAPEDLSIDVVLRATLEKMARSEFEKVGILRPFESVGPEDWQPLHIPVERETNSANEVEIKKRGRGRPPSRSSLYNYRSNEISRKKKPPKDRKKEIRKSSSRLDKRRKDDTDDSDYEDELIGQSALYQDAYRRLRAGRRKMDYDINNIVIPPQYGAHTRVEKLLYKEIIIPSFRILYIEPNVSVESAERPKKPGIKRGKRFLQKIDDDYEDVDDDIIQARHERCLEEERRKFNSFLNKQRNRRLRKTANDSTDADGVGDRTADSLETSLGSPPSTPTSSYASISDERQIISPEDASAAAAALKVISNRRRTISASKKDEEDYEEITIAPYPRRQFPISVEAYDEMQKGMPEDFSYDD